MLHREGHAYLRLRSTDTDRFNALRIFVEERYAETVVYMLDSIPFTVIQTYAQVKETNKSNTYRNFEGGEGGGGTGTTQDRLTPEKTITKV